jgi:hypothetical protein
MFCIDGKVWGFAKFIKLKHKFILRVTDEPFTTLGVRVERARLGRFSLSNGAVV